VFIVVAPGVPHLSGREAAPGLRAASLSTHETRRAAWDLSDEGIDDTFVLTSESGSPETIYPDEALEEGLPLVKVTTERAGQPHHAIPVAILVDAHID
jgi:hypothetical protein